MIEAKRAPENPILTPASVKPSRPDFKVVGAFNPAAIKRGDETLLLVRVAEAPVDVAKDEVVAPVWQDGETIVKRFPRSTPGLDADRDTRVFNVGKDTYLTSISHLRWARSKDGIAFTVDDAPALSAAHPLEAFGCEDARITEIEGTYWINYTAVSPHGIATALASSKDLVSFERHGIIFTPSNRDVTFFPEKIGGKFVAHHRPMPEHVGRPSIWYASSSDMLAWGDHRLVATARPGEWDDEKIGGGAPPVLVSYRGRPAWLAIYHGVTASPLTYSLGALVLDHADPSRILARSRQPILKPEAPFEVKGFFGNVVFTCGVVAEGDVLRIYYGAADGVTAVADLSIEQILADTQ